jgi:hypothetical protein
LVAQCAPTWLFGIFAVLEKDTGMKLLLGAAAAAMFGMVSVASAQTVEPSYKGDPSVYKVIFEDANFRVITIDRKKGVKDKAHSHPVAGVIYNITDCKTKLTTPDGASRENDGKAGTASATPIVASHQAENIGSADCKQVIVEKK